jgi:putative addiction module component (TIGR02574 family)
MSQVDDAFHFVEPLSPDDRLRLIARIWASLPPDHWAAPTAEELADVERRLAEHDSGQTADVPWEIVNRMLVNHAAPKGGRIYSAPRRFDLATIFAVTTAYSLLFAALSAIHVPTTAIAIAAGFITLVGIGQALLFGGQKPRLASALVGVLCYSIAATGYWLMGPPMMPEPLLLGALVYALFVGAVSGYVAGVLVGSVFLVADKLRCRFGRGAPHDVTTVNAAVQSTQHSSLQSIDPFASPHS